MAHKARLLRNMVVDRPNQVPLSAECSAIACRARDQGSPFTGSAWITTLSQAGVRLSMDGRGRYLDNIFIERRWRSLKQEEVYLEDIQDGLQVRRVIGDGMRFYNTERPQSSLERRTPKQASWRGRDQKLGSVDVHLNRSTVAAIEMKAAKLASVLQ